jgi:hypothetical protein
VVKSQNLDMHKWEHRIILIISNTKDSEVYKNQIKELKKSPQGLIERRLIIYHILPNQYKLVDYQNEKLNTDWISSPKLFKTYANEQLDFEVVLIGLDGDIKFQQSELTSTSRLFEIIDTMPMRKSEINHKND